MTFRKTEKCSTIFFFLRDTYQRKYPMSNLTSMYLLGTAVNTYNEIEFDVEYSFARYDKDSSF